MLVFAAIGVFGAGMLAIAAGIPIKEFGFGNTLILSGVLAWCTSAIMVTLWACVRDLKQSLNAPGRMFPSTEAEPPPSRAQASDPLASPQGWPETIPERAPPPPPAPAPPALLPAEPRAPRRNLLFASNRKPSETSLRDSAAPSDMPLAPATGPIALEESRPAPRRIEPPPQRSPRSLSTLNPRDPVPTPPPAAPAAVQPPAAPPPLPEPMTPPVSSQASSPPPSPQAEPAASRNGAARTDIASSAVTVLKSGVVDGMAYWLYSDGSIEAQMPEGMMRFGSIDELRAHLDKRA